MTGGAVEENSRVSNKRKANRDDRGPVLSRRSFLKGAGAAAAVAGVIGSLPPPDAQALVEEGITERIGPGLTVVELKVNGTTRPVTIEPRVTLLEVLRDHLGLTGAKLVCDRGACGSCTVHLDGRPVTACMVLAVSARGHEITTIEGLGTPDRMHPVQRAFVDHDALQCGFCTPGMAMSVAAAIQRNPGLGLEEIKRAVAGNICRCGTYPHVFAAALKAAAEIKGKV